MRYEFQDTKTGELVEVNFPMKDAPPIDSIIEHEGRWLKRVPSLPADVAVDNFTPFSSIQLPLHDPAAPHHDPKGRPTFLTRQEVRDFSRATKDRGNHHFEY